MDFDFDGDEFAFNGESSKADTKKSTMKRKKRTFGQRSHSATYGNSGSNANQSSIKDNKDDTNSSLSSFSSSIRSTSSLSEEITNGRRARRRTRRRQDYSNDDNDDDFDDDLRSTQSHSTSESYSVSSLRSTSRAELSVRRGTGAFCSQDAGTYQMVHDEVTYLCSTILSKTTLPSKAIDSALELANLLSSRKTRSMLWQDRSSSSRSNDQDSETDSQKSKKPAPIPKVWSSILQVLALAATTGASSENQFSSNSSIGSNGQTKPRTKSARRKEKALLGGSQTTNSSSNNNYETKLNADMKTILACILYHVSWDCTLSAEHSIAVLGAVQKPQVARRIRWAILERGSVLTSAMKLMVHSQQASPKQISSPQRWVPFPSKVVPTRTTGNASVSPLQTRKRSLTKSKAKSISISTTSKPAGDPTAMGRRKRKNRKKNLDTESMPPPAPRGDELSFADSNTSSKTNDDHSSILSSQASVPTRISKKIQELCAKIYIESSSSSESLESQPLVANDYGIKGDCPWLSIVCLEALQRILMGKEVDGKTSSLEDEEKEDNDDDSSSDNDEDPKENVVMVTNRLVGKSGMIPLLSHAWSQTMVVATKIVFGSNESKDDGLYWVYCYDRLKLIAHLIDEACFFSERNRTSFCQDDPFDFSSNQKNKGLVFHALTFLHLCSNTDLNQPDSKRSETMALALRTLTSLTHENHLAAKQMKDFVDVDFPTGLEGDTSDSIQGLAVLANLTFQLQESKPTKKSVSKRATDHELHLYDGTVFSLTTLANVIEDSGSGRILMELELKSKSGKSVSWLKWLCQWVVQQTETFRHDILSIGNTTDTKKHKSSEKNKGLNSDEEGKLLAAGNGCVVLACLICKSDGDDPESSHQIRNLIEDQMPPKADGSSSGLSLVVNTMKAHCNYYHMTMGQMGVAVVAPVKKLIRELEEIIGIG